MDTRGDDMPNSALFNTTLNWFTNLLIYPLPENQGMEIMIGDGMLVPTPLISYCLKVMNTNLKCLKHTFSILAHILYEFSIWM